MSLEATRTLVRGLLPRSALMFLCPYVLMSPALAAAKQRYGVSPYVSYSLERSSQTANYVSYVAYVLMFPR